MKLKKYIDVLIPKKIVSQPKRLIQARVPIHIVDELIPFMEKEHISWNTIVNAALLEIVDDIKKRKVA